MQHGVLRRQRKRKWGGHRRSVTDCEWYSFMHSYVQKWLDWHIHYGKTVHGVKLVHGWNLWIFRERKWQESGYRSLNLSDECESDEEASKASDASDELLEDEGTAAATDIHYVVGDVTHPQLTSPGDALVVHCVGMWCSHLNHGLTISKLSTMNNFICWYFNWWQIKVCVCRRSRPVGQRGHIWCHIYQVTSASAEVYWSWKE